MGSVVVLDLLDVISEADIEDTQMTQEISVADFFMVTEKHQVCRMKGSVTTEQLHTCQSDVCEVYK